MIFPLHLKRFIWYTRYMKFLIVKTSSIGDIIQTFPVVEYLKAQSPDCTIDWVVEEEYASLVKAHPGISEVHVVATRRWKKSFNLAELTQAIKLLKKTAYDVVFDLQGNTKSALWTFFAKAPIKVGFGRASVPEKPNLLVTNVKVNVAPDLPIQERYLSVVQHYFKDERRFEFKGVQLRLTSDEEKALKTYQNIEGRKIMVAFSSKWENKRLSFETLLALLKQETGRYFFVCGTVEEKQVADTLAAHFPESTVVMGLSFPLWQRVMGEMDLVISADSAALALCGTTSTPSFSFFGPTKASVYKPMGSHHTHFQGSCPYDVEFAARCPRLRSCKTGACLKSVKGAELFSLSQQKFQRHPLGIRLPPGKTTAPHH